MGIEKQIEGYKDFGFFQKNQIKDALEEGFTSEEIKLFAKKEFSHWQMSTIKDGIKELPMEQVQVFADSKFGWLQMVALKKCFEYGLTLEQVKKLAKPEFDDGTMMSLKDAFLNLSEDKVDFLITIKNYDKMLNASDCFYKNLSMEQTKTAIEKPSFTEFLEQRDAFVKENEQKTQENNNDFELGI